MSKLSWVPAGSATDPCCCCECTDETASYVVSISGGVYGPFTVALTATPCQWYVADGPCGPPGEGDVIETILFGDSCGWFLTFQYVGVWSITGVGPVGAATPVGDYVFPSDPNCDLSGNTVTVA